ncbi:DNA repair protein RadA/Sms [Ruminococcaceae bacterium YRB3002]|nr:DNA repair protein RadA/Sms [Ruminococcaceae bacterium YRB3002]
MAGKNSKKFFCKECGYESLGWLGKCPGCGAFNTFVNAPEEASPKKGGPSLKPASYSWTSSEVTLKLSECGKEMYNRQSSGLPEVDRLFGGGITQGSVTLVAGEPGIGKSTLLLQIADRCETGDKSILYVSGEESPAQIRMRAERLNVTRDILVCAQTKFETIAKEIEDRDPSLVIIDSIQTLYSEEISGTPGSVTQAREVTACLVRIAKTSGVSIILVGHITKEGSIAGPKILEHMVDTVLDFEGDSSGGYRILRVIKNRFGKSGELSFFEMSTAGLIPVANSSALLISGRPLNAPGSVLTAAIEGSTALPVEIQALVTDSCYNNPQRMTYGPDRQRANMIIAVCEKNFNAGLVSKDIFLNVISGLKISDPATDLAIASAIVSSVRDIPVRANTLILGEIGLSGEIRPVTGLGKRLSEVSPLGITSVVLPGAMSKEIGKNKGEYDALGMEFIFADNIYEAIDILFA